MVRPPLPRNRPPPPHAARKIGKRSRGIVDGPGTGAVLRVVHVIERHEEEPGPGIQRALLDEDGGAVDVPRGEVVEPMRND